MKRFSHFRQECCRFIDRIGLKQVCQLLVSGVVIVVFILLLLLLIWRNWFRLPGTWLGTMALVASALALAGLLTPHKSLLGILINKENRLSFSRLQILCWWVMLISLILVVAGARHGFTVLTASEQRQLESCRRADWDKKQPTEEECAALVKRTTIDWLDMSIPDGLLAAAGLSIGAAVVAAGVNSVKRNPSAKQAHDLDRQLRRLQEKKVAPTGATQKELLEAQIRAYTPANRHGFLKAADRPALTDLVFGSEVGNGEDLDWSKVQALLLSVMLLVLYGIAVWRMLSDPSQWIASETVSFPAFSGALAALLAVSLAGHEANKLPNHSIIDPVDP